MSLTDEERDAIVFYRIQKSKDTLNEAIGIAQLKYWNAVTNRLYYACYYITSALLIKNGHNAQTHSGVIRLLDYILLLQPTSLRFNRSFIQNYLKCGKQVIMMTYITYLKKM